MNNMNMRRTLKQPTLRMNSGGIMQVPMDQGVTPAAAPISQIGMIERATADYKSMQPQAAKPDPNRQANMLAAGGRTQTFQPMAPLAGQEQTRITPLQMEDGGERYANGKGGQVPGNPLRGDQFPAKYTGGEFVASNAMLDAEPGLREHLSELREKVLATQGKSVAQADAEALDYDEGPQGEQHEQTRDGKTKPNELEPLGVQGHRGLRGGVQRGKTDGPGRVTLHALDGFEVNERPWTSADSRAFAKQPGPGNPNVGPAGSAEAAAFRAPPVATPASGVSLEPTAARLLRDKAFGSSADWAKTANALSKERSFPGSGTLGKVVSKLAAPLAVGSGVYSAYQGASEGDIGKTALGIGDAVAGAALMTPAAPAAAGYLAARGAYEAPQMLRGAIGPRGLETIGGTINQIGRKTGLWGSDDSAYLSSKGAMPSPATLLRTPASQPQAAAQTPQPQATQPQAPQALRTGADGRQYLDSQVSQADRTSSDATIRSAFGGLDHKSGLTDETADDRLTMLRDNPGSLRKFNEGIAQRGSGIAVSKDARGGLVFSNSTAPEKMQYTGVDGKPTSEYRNTQQYADGLRDGQKNIDFANKLEAENKANAEAASAPRRGEFGFNKYTANKTALRGQDMTSADNRYGQELTAQSKKAQLRYDMDKDQRDFQTGRSDKRFEQESKGFEQQGKATDAALSMARQLHTTTRDGKSEVDEAGANQSLQGLQTMVAGQIADYEKSGNKEAADNLRQHNLAAMPPDVQRKGILATRLMNKVNAEASNANFFKPDFMKSSDPRDYIGMTRNKDGDWVTRTNQVIPARYLDKLNADRFWGQDINTFDLLKASQK